MARLQGERALAGWVRPDVGQAAIRPTPLCFAPERNLCTTVDSLSFVNESRLPIVMTVWPPRRQDLGSLLILPVQRVPRYRMLLESMLAKTPRLSEFAAERDALEVPVPGPGPPEDLPSR